MTALLCSIGVAFAAPPLNDDVDFARDVLPILSDSCFRCHGPDEQAREADLRLDTKDGALRAENAVIVPGDVGESELLRRVMSNDPDEVMPPPDSNRQLTATQKKTLSTWIKNGAEWGRHWSFVKPEKPALPESDDEWVRNEIDQFVLRRLVENQLRPMPTPGKHVLIRRATLDLTGLPPTAEEIDAFVDDLSPDAWEKVVDRLLASPEFGERMAWDWLDVARYADTNGYQGDRSRTMWPWRDWVVKAFNENMPYDKFTVEQLAGDMIPNATVQQKIATGFNRNHMINGEGGRIAEENRVEYIFDQVETTSTTWLGLTMTCSRCHDHKYDPISLDDYYGLFAVFNQTPVNGGGGNGQTPPVVEFKADGQTAKVMVMADTKKRDTFVLQRGTYNKPGRKVSASVVRGLNKPQGDEPVNRMTLAKWIVDPENPLTARVTVNRFWQTFFGNGLVRTPEDFGVQGQKPTHPELLDWLAVDFVENGWNVKRLIKQMLMSATYQQSSAAGLEAYSADPDNRLLARGARFRLPSWMIRDQALFVSGLLNPERGGPSVNSYQPEGVWAEATFGKIKYKQDSGSNLYRRSLYLFWRRIVGPTTFFDVAKRQTCEVKPLRTNSPLHALVTLNDVTYVEAARVFAEKLLAEHNNDDSRLRAGFRLVTGRAPRDRELALLTRRLQDFHKTYAADEVAAQKLASAGEAKRSPTLSSVDVAAYTTVCNLLLNLDEVITRE